MIEINENGAIYLFTVQYAPIELISRVCPTKSYSSSFIFKGISRLIRGERLLSILLFEECINGLFLVSEVPTAFRFFEIPSGRLRFFANTFYYSRISDCDNNV